MSITLPGPSASPLSSQGDPGSDHFLPFLLLAADAVPPGQLLTVCCFFCTMSHPVPNPVYSLPKGHLISSHKADHITSLLKNSQWIPPATPIQPKALPQPTRPLVTWSQLSLNFSSGSPPSCRLCSRVAGSLSVHCTSSHTTGDWLSPASSSPHPLGDCRAGYFHQL